MNYDQFLLSKQKKHISSGFDIDETELNKNLFDYQKIIVKKALKAGKYAIFADCGLGKTIMQLEWANKVYKKTQKPVIILTPLAVSGQTIQEGLKFSINVTKASFKYDNPSYEPEQIANYEQLSNIDCSIFGGVVLDESSILKQYTGKYKNLIIEKFKNTEYKLACTATPSPNDLNEIGNHSEFLDVLDSQDMRSKWFVRDEGMNNYRLKSHAKQDFYGWISSWATMISKPSDLGFSDDGYVLPPLNIVEHEIITDVKNGSGMLFNKSSINATNYNAELRETKEERLKKVVEICEKTEGQVLVWIKHNDEGDWLKKNLTDCKEVKGNDTTSYKEETLLSFAKGEFKILITKSKIAQFGMNFQNCSTQIFASLDFSFESFYQQVRRSYRFGQKKEVTIHIIKPDTMENVSKTIEKKERQFREMQEEMNKHINGNKYGLLNEYERKEYKTDDVLLIKGDSCIEVKGIPDNSVDLIIFSPPFSSLFTYSNYIHDMGNNESHEDFFKQYDYLLKELYRILKPGRLMCCHTKDLGVYKNSSGYTGMYDFTRDHTKSVINMIPKDWVNDTTGKNTDSCQDAGFKLHSKITIWCDPVLEMQRTKTQRLLYKTVTSDSTKTGIGMAEYITIFKKWDGSDESKWEPVTNITKQNFPLDVWQKWASPVWMDIKRTDVLNGKEGTDLGDEKHIAPLQLEVIHRLVNLWSNEGEIVFTPFLGIGSEIYKAVQNKRKGIGIELKDSYFDTAVKNIKKASESKLQLSLFD